jgi:hypothetical protein
MLVRVLSEIHHFKNRGSDELTIFSDLWDNARMIDFQSPAKAQRPCPNGTFENSPVIYDWVHRPKLTQSPGGTAEPLLLGRRLRELGTSIADGGHRSSPAISVSTGCPNERSECRFVCCSYSNERSECRLVCCSGVGEPNHRGYRSILNWPSISAAGIRVNSLIRESECRFLCCSRVRNSRKTLFSNSCPFEGNLRDFKTF